MLYIDEFIDIAKNVYSSKWLNKNYIEDESKLLDKFQENNNKFYTESKWLKQMAWVGRTICRNVDELISNEWISNNHSIIQTRWEIKADIAIHLHNERILLLIDILNKIPNLEEWSPTTLETLYRKKNRTKDSINQYEDIFSESEKKEIWALRSWLVSNIRKFNIIDEDFIKSTKVDWWK